MAIEYAGGTIVKTTLDGTVNTNFLSDLNAAMVAAGWTSTTVGSAYHLVSAKTPDGLQMKVVIDVSGAYASISARDTNDVVLGVQEAYIAAGITFECLATRYTVWIWLPGIAGSLPVGVVTAYASSFAFGVPFLPEPVKPLTVNGATNTSPIEITTIEDHGLITGTTVFISGVEGNTAANGSFVITSTAAKTFTLDGSTGSGAYTSGGWVGTNSRLSKAFYFCGSDGTGALPMNGWREDPFETQSTSLIASYSGYVLNAASDYYFGMRVPIVQPQAYPWRNTRSVITEAYIYAANATQAQVYGAVVIRGTPVPPLDATFVMDGHTWVVYGVGGTNSALAIAVN